MRRTKIVATLGPASADEAVLRQMLEAGVDVIRINSSHGSPATWCSWIERVRSLSEEMDRHVGVLVDLRGPRIRVGTLPEPLELADGTKVVFAPELSATSDEIPTTYPELANDVEIGSRVLLDDGLIVTEVQDIKGDRVHTVVRHGGQLLSNKGINLPGVNVSAPTVTEVDRETLKLAIDCGANFIGVSFVRRAEDIECIRELIPPGVHVVAKIEKAAAVNDLPRIVGVSDVLMVARGDLGVELPFEKVPLVQKRLIGLANDHACPVITATQMLESMIQHPRPTRAEASDVANAILDGTDAVMLSGETAIGQHPVATVKAMARIIVEVEKSFDEFPPKARRSHFRSGDCTSAADDAIASATTVAATLLDVPGIVCFTKSGFTARKISAHRPVPPIIGLSTEPETCCYLALVWGVVPVLAREVPTYDAMLGRAREELLKRKFVQKGDRVIVTAGVPFDVPGTTNLLKVETI
ncbi:MAG: pyruvate kinase [Gemmatimonadales bacterium]